jgi:hypothetical protein
MKITFNITVFFFICLALLSCEKYADDYKSFLNDEEMVYPGVARNVGYQAGDFRTKLYWNPSPDPTITKYVIKWNNGSDSLTVNTPTTNPAEQVTAIVTGLEEYVYSFVINSYDAAGNKSIPIEINNVRVYGDAYKSSLFNRTYNLANPYVVNNDRSVKLNFNAADTMNIATTISYTNTLGQVAEVDLLPGNTSITLPDYKFDTAVKYRSSYIPEAGSIDTFYVTDEVTFPEIIAYFECDKSLFREHRLPLDIDVYQFETGVFKLWDGSVGPQGYPNIFHTIDGGGVHLPHVITLIWEKYIQTWHR